MEYNYQYFEDPQLLIIQYKDEFTIQEYLDSQEIIQNHPKWSGCSKILIDIRNLSHPRGSSLVDELMKARNNEKLHDYKLGYLVEYPQTIVVIHLYIDRLNNPNYKYCSTNEAIIAHLNLQLNSIELDTMLQNLKN
ncbi:MULTISPECIES: hypothetical protein [unclassified Lentimicrobium]|uniref:hypothetical protein n=1 Tax=unclassified Lentimicrobium TaxID=2677434 RepID=UPI00155360F2|nr:MULTISPECIES: hypothetical protein [unclassified Lentimicrobium]NPD45036.1 hypothetical protein [Lentimicrobium sp. S6]NPD86057.1 hypothetical protein [Lentimicrobium sp. L6]